MNNQITALTIRQAVKEDTKLILDFIKELAVYENLLDKVTATEETLMESLFIKEKAKTVIAEADGKPVGYALYFYNFSTFLGKHGVYLEDIYIRPEYRGRGYGKELLSYIARAAKEEGCERLEWACLDWNEPSIKFYKQMGAHPMDEWTVYRVDHALTDLASRYEGQV